MNDRMKCGHRGCNREAFFRSQTMDGRTRMFMCAARHVTSVELQPAPVAPATEAHARRTDPETSHAAAASIGEDDLRKSQQAVLEAYRGLGRATDRRLAQCYHATRQARGWPKQSSSGLRTRRRELVDAKFLRDSGERVRLESGRKSIVWEVVR